MSALLFHLTEEACSLNSAKIMKEPVFNVACFLFYFFIFCYNLIRV